MTEAKTNASADDRGGQVSVRLRRAMTIHGIARRAGEVVNIDRHAAGVFVFARAADVVDGKELGPVLVQGPTVRTIRTVH